VYEKQSIMRDVPLDKQTEYAVEDASRFNLKEHFEKNREANTQKLFDDIEVPLLRVLAAMN
jgi:DNA polymerase-1